MKKYLRFVLSITAAAVLGSCSTGKYFFNKRIHHPSPSDEQQRKEVDSYIEKPTRNDNLTFYRNMDDTFRTVKEKETAVLCSEKTTNVFTEKSKKQGQQVLKKAGLPIRDKFSNVWQRKKIPDRPSFPAKKPITGHDKEGFILLIIIAALLIGLGLLFYFLLNALGLVFLILFSVAAGVLIILVLIALIL